MSGATGSTGPTTQSITVPTPNQPLTNGNTVDRVWWRFFSSLAGLQQTAASSSALNALTTKVAAVQQQVNAIPPTITPPPPSPDLSSEVGDLETEVALLMQQRPYSPPEPTPPPAVAIYAPLTNGDLPGSWLVGYPDAMQVGPTLLSDPSGQCIMVQVR